MEPLQREHIHAVMRLAGEGLPLLDAPAPDAVIRESWSRCVHEHGLDPTRMQEAVILPHQRVREHQERLEEFLHIARHGLFDGGPHQPQSRRTSIVPSLS